MFTIPLPKDTWSETDKAIFLREVWNRFRFNDFTWDAPNVPANSTVDTNLTSASVAALTGLRTGMFVYVTPPSTLDAGLTVGAAWVPADNQITIRLANVTAGALNPASGTWIFFAVIP